MDYNFKIMKLFLALIIIIFNSIQTECTLKSVHIVMRHGVRAPVFTYPLDPNFNNPNQWPNGLSELTDVGIEQAINVGIYLRKRYKNFYPNNPKNSILRSTNVDRSLDTIALVSGQLWPPNGKSDWVQPRIFTPPTPFDGVLSPNVYCPAMNIENYNNLNTPEVIAFNNENQVLLNYVSNKTGLPASMFGVLQAFDVFRSQKANGQQIPDWASDYFDKMGYVYYKYFDFSISGDLTFKFRSGLFFNELNTRMDQVLSSSIEADRWYKRFFIYATHDLEIFAFNKALGIKQSTYPTFLAMTIFELHEINDKLKVKVFYINETEQLPIGGRQVRPSFCPEDNCPYNTFISYTSNLIPDWKTDCTIPENWNPFPVLEQFMTITNDSIVYKPQTN